MDPMNTAAQPGSGDGPAMPNSVPGQKFCSFCNEPLLRDYNGKFIYHEFLCMHPNPKMAALIGRWRKEKAKAAAQQAVVAKLKRDLGISE